MRRREAKGLHLTFRQPISLGGCRPAPGQHHRLSPCPGGASTQTRSAITHGRGGRKARVTPEVTLFHRNRQPRTAVCVGGPQRPPPRTRSYASRGRPAAPVAAPSSPHAPASPLAPPRPAATAFPGQKTPRAAGAPSSAAGARGQPAPGSPPRGGSARGGARSGPGKETGPGAGKTGGAGRGSHGGSARGGRGRRPRTPPAVTCSAEARTRAPPAAAPPPALPASANEAAAAVNPWRGGAARSRKRRGKAAGQAGRPLPPR